MGATSPAWALRQEAGERSRRVKDLTSLPLAGWLTFAFQSLKQGAMTPVVPCYC